MAVAADASTTFGDLLRSWRTARHLSQLDLSVQASVSARHLSFIETGRSKPSRELVLHLAETLDVPLRDQNALLVAAGYAPQYRERAFDDPELASVRRAIDVILEGHAPSPALAVDRAWNIVAANAGVAPMLALLSDELAVPPVNALRASLHPDGLAKVIANFDEYASHLVARVRRQVGTTGDRALSDLLDEVSRYPRVAQAVSRLATVGADPVLPLRIRLGDRDLSFFTTMTIFGAPLDVTVEELAIELFFPADEATEAAIRQSAA